MENQNARISLTKPKKLKVFLVLFMIVPFVFFSSCNTSHTSAKLSLSSKRIYQGETVSVRLKVKGKQNRIERMTLNGVNLPFITHIDTNMMYDRDTVVEFRVYVKGQKKPIYRKQKLRVFQPKINGFMCYRDRFNSSKVYIKWDVEGVKKLNIEGIGDNLSSNGIDSVITNKPMVFKLTAMSPIDTLTDIQYVKANANYRPYIKGSMSVDLVEASSRFQMEVVETDIQHYPDVVKMKVLVFDSAGQLITNLAPPYNTEEFARKYFKRLTENVGDMTKELDFTVREVHNNPEKYDMSLVLDYSGSMTKSISILEKATARFIHDKEEKDRYSLVKYDNQLHLLSGLESRPKRLIRKSNFEGLKGLGGGTAMYAAIGMGVETLDESNNKKVVLLFTDGNENSSLAYLGDYAATINEAIDVIREKNAHLIIMGMGEVNNTLLRELSYYTNGTYYSLENEEEIYDVYNELSHNFSAYYEITIRAQQKDGEHSVHLEYYNNVDTVLNTTQHPFYVGNSYDFLNYEEDTAAYWYSKKLKEEHYTLAVAPQSLVNFSLNDDKIDAKYQKSLLNIIRFIKKDPSIVVRIYGHTDTQGEEDANMELSKRRAQAVYRYMRRHGVSASNMRMKAYGESQPIWKNDEAEWAARENRRVEIVLWRKL